MELNNKLNIVYKKVEELIPYVNNPRNNKDAVDKVASSIKNFGFKVPIVIDAQNEIITGHTRLLASKKLGIEEVPVIIADDLSEAQVKAFRIADNKVSEYAEWDMDLLKVELEELDELDFDLEDTGFEMSVIDDLIFSDMDDLDDIPDDLELERDSTTTNPQTYLKFKQYNIMLSEEEEMMFSQAVEEYIERTGVLQGFVNHILGGQE